ncbi:MAG TPA: hypothetical protein VHD90_15570 [Phototrophicaceae bacterium]|nr:hypothetical protein [Phototrophicaceae bacterium]
MTDQVYTHELLEQVNKLDGERQRRLLNYARLLANVPQVRGESGKNLIASAGMFRQQDLEEMQRAIEEDCERIDWSEWE